MTDKHVPAAGLVRGLGLAASTSVVVGTVIGTGIFLKTRVMMCNVETPWLVAGGVGRGGRAQPRRRAHVRRARGHDAPCRRRVRVHPGGATAVQPRFLYGWTQFAVAFTGSQAAKGVSFAIFLNSLSGGALDRTFFTAHLAGYDIPLGELQSIALGVIILATLVNCLAVSVGGGISVVLTGAEDPGRWSRLAGRRSCWRRATGDTSP